MSYFLIAVVISFPLSVTLHHGLISVGVLYFIYKLFKEKKYPSLTLLGNPLHLFNFSTLASAFLYMPEKLREAFSSSFLRYGYLLPFVETSRWEKLFYNINRLLVLEGLILIPVFLYNFFVENRMKLLWGNMMKVAEIYALFTLSAVFLALYKRSIFYTFLAVVFFLIMAVPVRRAEILGVLMTLFLLGILYLRDNPGYVKRVLAALAVALLAGCGGFYYMAEKEKDPRFRVVIEILKGEKELSEETINRLTTTRWNNLKAGLVIIGRDFKNTDIVPLLIGHGIYSGHKLVPPPPNGLPYYESVVFVQEMIQRGILGLTAMILIFIRSLKLFISVDLRKRENLMLSSMASYLVFYNFSSLFTPYVNATFPVALFMFGLAEACIRKSPTGRIQKEFHN